MDGEAAGFVRRFMLRKSDGKGGPDARDALAAAIDAERAAAGAAARAAEAAGRGRAEADRRGATLQALDHVPTRVLAWKADRLRQGDGAGGQELPADLAAARAQRDDAVRELGDAEAVSLMLAEEAKAAADQAQQATAAVRVAADAVVQGEVVKLLALARDHETAAGRLRALASGYTATWAPVFPPPDPAIIGAVRDDLHRLLLDRSGLAHDAGDAAVARFRRELLTDADATLKP